MGWKHWGSRSASFLNGVYYDLQLLSFFLLSQHMVGVVRRVVVDVTSASDELKGCRIPCSA